MGWFQSEIIEFLAQGSSVQDIIDHYGIPVVNEKYIGRIIKYRTFTENDRTNDLYYRNPKTSAPGKDSKLYRVWEWAQNHGGLEKFLEDYNKTFTPSSLAKELGIDNQTVINFRRNTVGNYRDRDPAYGHYVNTMYYAQVKAGKVWKPKHKRKKEKSKEQNLRELF